MVDQVPRVSALRAFIEHGLRAGLYTPSQAQNLRVALRLVEAQAKEDGLLNPEQLTVEQIGSKIDDFVLAHGQRTGASESSQRTYASRLRRLVADFKQQQSGEVAASPRTMWRVRVKKPERQQTLPGAETLGGDDLLTYDLRLPEGGRFEVRVPRRTTKSDLAAMWRQLDALRVLLEARAEVEGEWAKPNEAGERER